MQIRSIQKEIASGKRVLIVAVIFAIAVRVLFFLYGNLPEYNYSDVGYMWGVISSLFDNLLVSMLVNMVAVSFIAGLVSFMNSRFVLIREKTSLPEAFFILFLSSHPFFLITTPYLIGVIFIIGAAYHLFNTYNSPQKTFTCANIIFELTLASLFVTQVLVFCLVFFIGFAMMRNLTLKSLLSSFTTILFVYVPVAFYFFATENMDAFLLPFRDFGMDSLFRFPFMNFEIRDWVILSVGVLYVIFLCIANYMSSYKDKILIRTYINFLSVLTIFSLLFYVFLNLDSWMNIFVAFFGGAFLMAHYYALVRGRGVFFFFLFSIVIYLTVCYNTFM